MSALASGGGDASTVDQLLAVERSWRLLQLRALLDQVGPVHDTGPLPPVRTAWDLLIEAERHDPAGVGDLLLHPQAGVWAGYTLRRLRGTARSQAPLWVDLGYLHGLAAVAALRAGLDFRITVVVRDGFVVLPTLGAVPVPGAEQWGHTEVRGSGGDGAVDTPAGAVRIGGDGWQPMPAVHLRAGGHTLAVRLDCLDPYRNLRGPTPPRSLSEAELDHWRGLLAQAWELLVHHGPALASPMARGLFSVVPQPPAERFRTMSASAGDAFGSMIMSEPRDATELAVTMVHEFQHIKLGALLHLAPLHSGEPDQRLYAPWRDDPRPLGGLLQGVYAFAGITEFWRAFRHGATDSAAALAHFEFARWRRQVATILTMVARLPQLTEVGRRLVDGLTATAEQWQADSVPARPLAAAHDAVADHRGRWRLHHLQPPAEVVTAYAEAWTAGAARPEPPSHAIATVLQADPAARGLDARAVLELWRLTDPAGFERLSDDPEAVGDVVTGAGAADLALVAGDHDAARHGYLAELSAGSDRPGAWAGLGLILTGPAAEALQTRPELVRAVHQALRSSGGAVDLEKLAAWIGPA
ncbi:HEXXH motif domain-containing protein [Actinoplanes sp. CA-252034]|uniref:HEXXH motif domain-containing protein n=1 Tax=Actinoplanes sp. CA-252034 TaxID=3239906 RepID=UPI003D96E6A4